MDVHAIQERQFAICELLKPEVTSDTDALRSLLKDLKSRDLYFMLSQLSRYDV